MTLIMDSIADYIPSKWSYQWNKKYIIYADTDVMFMKDINQLDYRPPLISVGPEISKDAIANTDIWCP